jgi:hypothetical protein
MKLTPSRWILVLAGGVLALASRPAMAELRHERGTILNMDWRAMQVQLKDAKDRERIWPVAKDATVKFTDQAWAHRNPTLKDLRVGMYVHITYSTGDPEIIQEFDVKDVGKAGAAAPAPDPGAGAGGSYNGRVTAVDTRVAQVEVMLDQGGRKTFQAANARVLAGIRAGDRVTLVTQSQGGQDIVVEVKRR